MRSPDPPPAPDPYRIAGADAAYNRIDQYTPMGSLTFGGPLRNQATLEFSPEVQGLYDQQQQIDANLLGQALQQQGFFDPTPFNPNQFGLVQSGFDTTGLQAQGPQVGNVPQLTAPTLQQLGPGPQFQGDIARGQIQGELGPQGPIQGQLDTQGLLGLPTDIPEYRGDVEQAFFDRQRALLDPVFSDQERALTQRLATQGLPRSGEAVDRDMTRFLDARNRAYTDLSRNAVLAGGAEASRQLGDVLATRGQGFGEALAGGQFANQAQGQGFGQGLAGAQFANQSQGQGFGQNLSAAQFANAAAQQGFQNLAEQIAFNNQAGLLGLGANQGIRGQMTDEAIRLAGAGNAANAQNLALNQQMLQNANAARMQNVSDAAAARSNQFNELASLLGLQQVQQPGLNNFFGPGNVDVLGANALQQNALQNQYLADANRTNAFNTGLFGLGGALIGAPSGGFFSGLFSRPTSGGSFGPVPI